MSIAVAAQLEVYSQVVSPIPLLPPLAHFVGRPGVVQMRPVAGGFSWRMAGLDECCWSEPVATVEAGLCEAAAGFHLSLVEAEWRVLRRHPRPLLVVVR